MHSYPMHNVDSRLELRFTRCDATANNMENKSGEPAATRLHLQTQEPPQRVVRSFTQDLDGAALTHLHNLSGGVLGGDRLALNVTVAPKARAQITTTGATRIYRHRAHMPDARQSTSLVVGPGGLLEYLPDPLIPFAESRFTQKTRIELAQDAGIFYWESVAPGRVAADEMFAYTRLGMQLEICAEGVPILLEGFELEPEKRPLHSAARLGEFLYFGAFYACRVGVAESRWIDLVAELETTAQELTCPQTAIWGVSRLPAHGLVVRTVAMGQQTITQGQISFWRKAKHALYGIDAVPPRKLY